MPRNSARNSRPSCASARRAWPNRWPGTRRASRLTRAPDRTTAHGAVDAVWRIESPRLIAALARMVGDVGLAEELAQDALVIALETWPTTGVPEKPGAWLMSTAKHRAIDALRRNKRLQEKQELLGRDLELDRPRLGDPELDAVVEETPIPDDL